MTQTLNNLTDQLKTLTLMEATELVTEIEDVFNVDASPIGGAVMVASGAEAVAEESKEEKTTFDVMVEAVASEKRVALLKVIRKNTDLGLADAKAFTMALPKVLKEGISKDEAETMKVELEAAGGTVTIV